MTKRKSENLAGSRAKNWMVEQQECETRDLPVGVFDSGIGGLTVVRQLLRSLPAEGIIYFGDTARVPYGTKSAETVTRFTLESARFLLHKGIKFLVLACNTASAVALPTLRQQIALPMTGVIEPGVQAALQRSRSGRIGVIGTEATIRSGAYEKTLRRLRPDLHIAAQACPLFVPLAEEGWLEGRVPELVAEHYLAPLREQRIDTLILGCTHYPLLKSVLARLLGDSIHLVDSAEETGRAVAAALANLDLTRRQTVTSPAQPLSPYPHKARGETAVSLRCYASDVSPQFRSIGSSFLGVDLGEVQRVEQSDLPWYDRPQEE